MAFTLTLVIGALFFGLPVAGVVLAAMLIAARRTGGLNQLRAGIAAVDAQLRLLRADGPRPD